MVQNTTGYTEADLGGGVQGVCNLRFSNTTGILQKKKKKLCGLLVLK